MKWRNFLRGMGSVLGIFPGRKERRFDAFLNSLGEKLIKKRAQIPPHGGPVRPVNEYCAALEAWRNAIHEAHARGEPDWDNLIEAIDTVELSMKKSNLLYRLIYLGEKLRTKPCPIHKGHWSGCSPDPCPEGCSSGSDITGWLEEPR